MVEHNDQNRQNGLKENISRQAIPELNSKVRRRGASVGKCQKDHETYNEDSCACNKHNSIHDWFIVFFVVELLRTLFLIIIDHDVDTFGQFPLFLIRLKFFDGNCDY